MDSEKNKRVSSQRKLKNSQTAGTVYSNVSSGATVYGEEKFHAIRGHGFAAERANTLYDRYTGHDARILGDDNAKNGADRLVDGVEIQSKYCKTGGKCISECFENGQFRYIGSDGKPMQIEVPSDKYESAIQAMQERIRRGEVPGVSDPNEAQQIVRKGHFTYEQAKNIAKAGTVESLTYDAANGMIIASSAFGVTAVLTFATSVWNGDTPEIALKNAAYSGLKVGGISFVTAIFAGQLSKAGLNSLLVGSSEAVVRVMGPKTSALLVNAFRQGKNIYGAAAMKSASKLLRGNIITGSASVVILSAGDVVNIFRGRISGKQLFKNVTNTASSVAGGTAGWVGGAAAGAAIGSAVPIIGTAVGGVIGGLAGAFGGGALAGKASSAVMDHFIEDDAEQMCHIIEQELLALTEEHLITQNELKTIVERLGSSLTAKTLKDMYASNDRQTFARKLLLPLFKAVEKERKPIHIPNAKCWQKSMELVLEQLNRETPVHV